MIMNIKHIAELLSMSELDIESMLNMQSTKGIFAKFSSFVPQAHVMLLINQRKLVKMQQGVRTFEEYEEEAVAGRQFPSEIGSFDLKYPYFEA